MSEIDVKLKSSPLLGEHNEEVLRDWLGMSAEEVKTLKDHQAI